MRLWSKEVKFAKLTDEETKKGWGGVAWGFYGTALRKFQDAQNWSGNQCNVYAFGYDWRQSNTDSGKKLKAFIEEVIKKENGAEKVILITHSMGGLVARAACQQGAEQSVLGVVHAVIPAVGSAVAYRRLKTGARMDLEDGDFPLTLILGQNAPNYRLISCGLRGPFELLPSNLIRPPHGATHWLSFDSGLSEVFIKPFSNNYDTYRNSIIGVYDSKSDWFGFNPTDEFTKNRLINRADEAEVFHNNLGSYHHPTTFVIAVNGYKTDCETRLLNQKGYSVVDVETLKIMREKRMSGDSTVQIQSQTALPVPPERQHIYENQTAPKHGNVFNENLLIPNKVIEFVNQILQSPKIR